MKMDMKVENGKVTAFGTRVSLSFKYEASFPFNESTIAIAESHTPEPDSRLWVRS